MSEHAACVRRRRLGAIAVLTGLLAACGRDARSWPRGMLAQPSQKVAELVTAERGHPVLFALYASWCRDCRAELPVLDDLDARYRGRGLSVVALSLDEDPVDFAEMMRGRAPRSLALVRGAPLDERTVAESIGVLGASWTGAIPYVALFDRSGRLRRQWPAGGATKSELEVAGGDAL